MTSPNGRLVEIFSSVQGEGLWVGRPQVFVRFHGCRLHCDYCDTPATHKNLHSCRIEEVPFSGKFSEHSLEFSPEDLSTVLSRFPVSSLALTGGEPLEQADFILAWLTRHRSKETLLETSGVEVEALEALRPLVTMVSADIKIPSATREAPQWDVHDRFLTVSEKGPSYAKVVYDEKMTDEEVGQVSELMDRHSLVPFVFQPVMPLRHRDLPRCLALFSTFMQRFPYQVRLIPQTHKFLSVL